MQLDMLQSRATSRGDEFVLTCPFNPHDSDKDHVALGEGSREEKQGEHPYILLIQAAGLQQSSVLYSSVKIVKT